MKLEKCPFCGEMPTLVDDYDAADDLDEVGGPWWKVVCRNCNATQGRGFPKKLMVDKWNLRGKHD